MSELTLKNFKNFTLEDKSIFDNFFAKFSPTISEYTFTNLFMWNNKYRFKYAEHENTLYILVKDTYHSKLVFFPPIGPSIRDSIKILQQLSDHENKSVEIQRIDANAIDTDTKNEITLIEDRNNWDYLYSTEELASFEGGKYANIRKKMNKFVKNQKVEYKKLDKDQVDVCIALQEEWCEIKSCDEDEALSLEHAAILESFEQWDVLQFSGGLLYADGKVVAYTLGEMLNKNTMVTHIEKANPLVDGAYQAITKEFNIMFQNQAKFTNREQDLGEPGLRTSKERLHPIGFIEKSIIKL